MSPLITGSRMKKILLEKQTGEADAKQQCFINKNKVCSFTKKGRRDVLLNTTFWLVEISVGG